MKQLVTVEQPKQTVEWLVREIKNPCAPVMRSSHVGNQPPHELALLTEFPPGIEVLHVDTIQANDSYTSPNRLILDNCTPLLRQANQSKGRLAVHSTITLPDQDEVRKDDAELRRLISDRHLSHVPEQGAQLTDFHMSAIDLLQPNNNPQLMTEYFAQHPHVFEQLMSASLAEGLLRAKANPDGTIGAIAGEAICELGIFGMDTTTPKNEGAMITLEGMMAMDIILSTHKKDATETVHLAGPDMIRYTQDEILMTKVDMLYQRTCAALGIQATKHCYKIVDITGLKHIVPQATHASQHQLLRTHGTVQINLDAHGDKPLGSCTNE